jgi:hypothetical protein
MLESLGITEPMLIGYGVVLAATICLQYHRQVWFLVCSVFSIGVAMAVGIELARDIARIRGRE